MAKGGWKPVTEATGSWARHFGVQGVKELDELFANLSKGVANRIARPGLMKAGRVVAKYVKASVPSRHKRIRKLIGMRSLKTKFNGGYAGVKVGAIVGKANKVPPQSRSKKRPGVGIEVQNVHWWFLGTQDRTTGYDTKRRRLKTGGSVVVSRRLNNNVVRHTGRMKPQTASVSSITNAHRGELVRIMRESIAFNIEKEAARQAKKAASR